MAIRDIGTREEAIAAARKWAATERGETTKGRDE